MAETNMHLDLPVTEARTETPAYRTGPYSRGDFSIYEKTTYVGIGIAVAFFLTLAFSRWIGADRR